MQYHYYIFGYVMVENKKNLIYKKMTAKEISEKIQAFTINNPGKFMPETFRQLIEDHIIHFSKQQIKEYREWEKNKTNLKKIYRKMMK